MNTGTSIQSAASPAVCSYDDGKAIAVELTDDDRQEVLEFLSLRPFNTIILAGWILDHGIVSPRHRGKFFGSRDQSGSLVGVAMIGHNLLFEARTEEAVISFAKCARDCPGINMVFAEEDRLTTFWHHFREGAPMPTISRHRLIMSDVDGPAGIESVDELRVASLDDLDHVVNVHAQIVTAETGFDPLQSEPEAFRERCAARVNNGRVWVLIRNDQLIFKTDIVSVTDHAVYGEGLWVAPEARGRGFGTRCLVSLCRNLSLGSAAFCGFLDSQRPFAESIYAKAGFTEGDEYARIYL